MKTRALMSEIELFRAWFDEIYPLEEKKNIYQELLYRYQNGQLGLFYKDQWEAELHFLKSKLEVAKNLFVGHPDHRVKKNAEEVYRQYQFLQIFQCTYSGLITAVEKQEIQKQSSNIVYDYCFLILKTLKSKRRRPSIQLMLMGILKDLIRREKVSYSKMNIESWWLEKLREGIHKEISDLGTKYYPEREMKILSYIPEGESFWDQSFLREEQPPWMYDRSLEDLTSEDFADEIYNITQFKRFYREVVDKHVSAIEHSDFKFYGAIVIDLAQEKQFDYRSYPEKAQRKVDKEQIREEQELSVSEWRNPYCMTENERASYEAEYLAEKAKVWENIFDFSADLFTQQKTSTETNYIPSPEVNNVEKSEQEMSCKGVADITDERFDQALEEAFESCAADIESWIKDLEKKNSPRAPDGLI